MNELLLIVGMALVTFLIRYPVLAIFGKLALPDVVLRALKYVPAAVLTAIIAPAVLMPDNAHVQIALNNPYLIGGAVAVLVSWRTRNLMLTIVLGMVSFWLWRALLSG